MSRAKLACLSLTPIVRMFAVLALVLCLATPAMAAGPDRGDDKDTIKTSQLEDLVARLKDDKARAQFLSDVEALIEADKATGRAADDTLLGRLSDSIGNVGQNVMSGVVALRDVPLFTRWVMAKASDPKVREQLGLCLAQLVGILVIGLICQRLSQMGLARARRAMATPVNGTLVTKLPLAFGHTLIEAVPVAIFAAAGYAATTVFELGGNPKVAALTLITAWASVNLVLVVARFAFAPDRPGLRLVSVDDETAEYLMIWVRRLAGVGLFGWFMAQAAGLLGLPPSGHRVVLKALGLVVAAMAIIFILQNRQAVGDAMRRAAGRLTPRMGALAVRFADVWHVLAAIYVAAIYLVWALPVKGGDELMVRATLLTVVIIVVARLALGLLMRGVNRIFDIGEADRERFPRLEARANRYLPVLQAVIRIAVMAIAALALLQAWGAGGFAWLTSETGRRLIGTLISISAVLCGAVVVWEIISGAIERYLSQTLPDGSPVARSARVRTLLPLARNVMFVVMAVMVTLIILSELGVDIAPLLAGAGVFGIAIGFGAQKLVQDVITGAFILFEDTISVGDTVEVAGHSGTVEAISIRAIRLRDGKGAIHTVPFSTVGTVVNMNRGFSFAVFDVVVDVSEDTDRVAEVLAELGRELKADRRLGPLILEPLEVMGVERHDAGGVLMRAQFKTLPLKQLGVVREFNRRIKKRFEELDIKYPRSWTHPAPQPAAS